MTYKDIIMKNIRGWFPQEPKVSRDTLRMLETKVSKTKSSWKRELALTLVIVALLCGFGFSLQPIRSQAHPVHVGGKINLTIPVGQSVSAQILGTYSSNSSLTIPWTLYVFEKIEYEVHVTNMSGGHLEADLIRNGRVLRTEPILSSQELVVSGGWEYRFQVSNGNLVLRAIDDDVHVDHVIIAVLREVKVYNPLLASLGFTSIVALVLFPLMYLRRNSIKQQVDS